jgi:dTDP-4-amino-4,6-dideoxy-D-galactose acyltransferase
VKRLDFDSEILGITVGQADSALLFPPGLPLKLEDWRSEGYRLVYLNVPSERTDLATALTGMGFEPIAGRTVFRGGVPPPGGTAPSSGVGFDRVDGEEAGPDWVALACQSGQHSHYRRDPRIPEESFREVYRRWIVNSLTGKVSDAVFAARVGGRLAGLVTGAVRDREGNIGLLAVKEGMRQQGIGRRLMHEAFAWMRGEGLSQWNVVTQTENEPACRFYASLGARPVRVESTYHLWL